MLIEPDWLATHLDDPAVRVVEVDVSTAAYDQWHIDGAVLWNVYADLKDHQYRPVDTAAFERLVSRSGIESGSTVVFYGYAPALGYWLLKRHGHADVGVLNCSREAWRSGGHPHSGAPSHWRPTQYQLPEPNGQLRADRDTVQAAIGEPGTTLLDVRSTAEYAGERFWPSGGMEPGGRAGHIPTAVHQPFDDVYDERGAFRSAAALRQILPAIDLDAGGELITYCTIGGRAATAWYVLTELLGHDDVRVYDGSWAEWGLTPHSPIEEPQPTEADMSALIRKSLDTPEEVRKFEAGSGQLELVNLDTAPVGRATFQPGWRWSEHVKPIAQTDSCQAAHTCYFVAGRMKVVADDGEEMEYGPGDFAIMAPGHDAWTVGDQQCVVIDWQGFADYAKRPQP